MRHEKPYRCEVFPHKGFSPGLFADVRERVPDLARLASCLGWRRPCHLSMNAIMQKPPVPQRESEWPGQAQSTHREYRGPTVGTKAAGDGRSDGPAVFLRILAPPVQAPVRIEVSAVLSNSLKTEVYDAWMNFNRIPAFLRGVHGDPEMERFPASWDIGIADGNRRWEARAIERVSAERIAWQSLEGAAFRHRGSVSFARAGRDSTRVSVTVEFDDRQSRLITERMVRHLGPRLCGSLEVFRTFARLHASFVRAGSVPT